MKNSDYSSTTIKYSKKDADFHVLQERIGTNSSKENLSLTNNLKLGALFPSDFGISFPLVVSLECTNVEKGKDIINKSGLNVIAADNLSDAAKKIVSAVKGD